VGIEEREEAALEEARREGLADRLVLCKELPDRRCPRPSGVARDEGVAGGRAREAPDLRLVERVLEVLLGYDRGDVQEGACGGGHRIPAAVVTSSGRSSTR
jgi:hypothetical protein